MLQKKYKSSSSEEHQPNSNNMGRRLTVLLRKQSRVNNFAEENLT